MNLELEITTEPRVKLSADTVNNICATCSSGGACVFKNNKVHTCEEFSTEISGNLEHAELITERPVPVYKMQSGICSTCSHFHKCSWRDESAIKFHCEHYQ